MKSSKLRQNVTGADTAPEKIEMMLEACKEFPPDVEGDEHQLEEERINLTTQADPIGSIPLPITVKGKVKASFNKITGKHPEIFLDKLGERLAFERSGVRLYEAALAKAKGLDEPIDVLQQLEHIRSEEAEHMEIIKHAIIELDADPTAMTPAADIAGVLGQGLMQILTDPRINMTQALEALLNTELIDNAGWELLIRLAMENDKEELAEKFEKALHQEQEHLSIIKQLLQDCLDITESS